MDPHLTEIRNLNETWQSQLQLSHFLMTCINNMFIILFIRLILYIYIYQ